MVELIVFFKWTITIFIFILILNFFLLIFICIISTNLILDYGDLCLLLLFLLRAFKTQGHANINIRDINFINNAALYKMSQGEASN